MSLARPVLEDCCPIWSPRHRKDIDKLEKIQRSAERFVMNRPQRGKEPGSVTSMLSELGQESLEARTKRRSLVSFYKLVNSCFQLLEARSTIQRRSNQAPPEGQIPDSLTPDA